MQNRKPIVSIALGIVAVLSLVYGTIISSGKSRRPAQHTAEDCVEPVDKRQHFRRTEFTSWRRNPFTLTKAPAQIFQSLVLKGIIRDARGPLAVINDVIAGVGDKVGANTVVEIKEDRVILDGSSGKFELELEQ